MFTYKRTIKSGPLTEIEYYRSFRKIGENYGGRKINQSLTPEKQKELTECEQSKICRGLYFAILQAVTILSD